MLENKLKGNLKSEQITLDGTILLDHDHKLVGKNVILKVLQTYLGKDVNKIPGNLKQHYIFKTKQGKDILLLCAAITYMGGNGIETAHPKYLKRIQIPSCWPKIVAEKSDEYDVRFLGVYNYNGNHIFCDVGTSTFIKRNVNNSSAHIYLNDLYQTRKKGIFSRIDQNENKFISVSSNKLYQYLNKERINSEEEFDHIKGFNNSFFSGEWISAIEAVKEMYMADFSNWRQTEWAGWFLEYKFEQYLKKNLIDSIIYTSCTPTNSYEYNLDLWFGANEHYGDLKASDTIQSIIIGNDLEMVEGALEKYGKLWYLVYEHETEKDKNYDYIQTKKRFNYIQESKNPYPIGKNPMSYSEKMKNSVLFTKMFVLELNEANYLHYTSIFKQGRQQNGDPRKSKIKFSKNEIQNAVVFSFKHKN